MVGGVAGDRTVSYRQYAFVVDAAAVRTTGVAGEAAVGHRQRAGVAVDAAASVRTGIAGEGASGDCHCAVAIDSAAAEAGRIAVSNRQVGDGHSRYAGIDREYGEVARRAAAGDRHQVRQRCSAARRKAGDRRCRRNHQRVPAGQRDRVLRRRVRRRKYRRRERNVARPVERRRGQRVAQAAIEAAAAAGVARQAVRDRSHRVVGSGRHHKARNADRDVATRRRNARASCIGRRNGLVAWRFEGRARGKCVRAGVARGKGIVRRKAGK